MPSRFRSQTILYLLLAVSLLLHSAAMSVRAQDDAGLDEEDAADPVKLFERGQDAHQRGAKDQLELAVEFYEQALKLRPEFPEAEYQKGAALVSLGREAEGEKALRRALELRPAWTLPHASLGAFLASKGREREAGPLLARALELDPRNMLALTTLAALRRKSGDLRGELELWKRVTALENATAAHWLARGLAEHALGENPAALSSLDKSLALDPQPPTARLARAEVFLDMNNAKNAVTELRLLEEAAKADVPLAADVARIYARAGQTEKALSVLDALGAEAQKLTAVEALRTKILADTEESAEARTRLEELATREPQNVLVLARLGWIYRTLDPQRALEYYRRAAELEPQNVKIATGYAGALVQARRFQEAAQILTRVVAAAPQEYEAHANLATALDKLNLYGQALAEYKWLRDARPENVVTYFFIARMHDQLGEYSDALANYETFLARADAARFQFQIDQINLRLPVLREQVKRGEGTKAKRKGAR